MSGVKVVRILEEEEENVSPLVTPFVDKANKQFQ